MGGSIARLANAQVTPGVAPPRCRLSRPARRPVSGQKLFQHHGFIVFLISSAEQEGESAFASLGAKLVELRGVLAQLAPIAFTKFMPELWIMIEPLTKFCRWRDGLHPEIQRCTLLAHTPGARSDRRARVRRLI
jgi:hypothetical protein